MDQQFKTKYDLDLDDLEVQDHNKQSHNCIRLILHQQEKYIS